MKGVRFSLVLMFLASVACESPVEGTLVIESPEGRTIEFEPERCADGHHSGYFGVELMDEDERLLEFRRDAGEPLLAFYAPAEAAFELTTTECEQLEGELHRESLTHAEAGEVRGSLEIDCVARNGWSVQGSLSFQECHAASNDVEIEEGQ